MAEFIVHSEAEQAQMLALKLPDGACWLAKTDASTTLYKFLLAWGLELMRLEANLNYTSDELALQTTNDLIDVWELEYGIPASCLAPLSEGASLEIRINNILTWIFAEGTSTEEQFEAVALKLGLVVDVMPGGEYASFPLTFPHVFIGDQREIRFIIVVDMKDVPFSRFDFIFDFVFGNPLVSILKCIFNRLKPANCKVVYINEGAADSNFTGSFSDGFSNGFAT